MKKIYLFLFISGLVFNSFAQSGWTYLEQGTATWPGALANDVVENADGSFVSAGSIGLIDIVDGEMYVVKNDAEGNVVWEKHIDKPETEEIVFGISALADGGYLISAITFPFYLPYLVKINADGDVVWTTESWTDLLPVSSAVSNYAYQQSSGDIVMINDDASIYGLNVYTIDEATGAMTSNTSYIYADYFPFAFLTGVNQIVETADNGFILAGYSTDLLSQHGFLWKFNSALEEEYLNDIYLDDKWTPTQIATNSGDGYFLCGVKQEVAFLGETYTTVIVKTDLYGDTLWTKEYPGDLDHSRPWALAQMEDGNVRFVNAVSNEMIFEWSEDFYVEVVHIDNSEGSIIDQNTLVYAEWQAYTNITGVSGNGYMLLGSLGDIGGSPDFYSVIISDNDGNLPDCIFNCVWPGDADNSGAADMDDILALGVSYGNTGAARDDASIDWYAHNAESWLTMLPDSTNDKYTDCNGDGIINDDDTTAINLNYANEHAVYSLKTSGTGAPLFVEDPGFDLTAGYHELPIILGDVITPVDNIYGIRFTIEYDGENLEAESTTIKFDDSWFGTTGEVIQSDKNNSTSYFIDAAIVRTNKVNTSGFGDIGTINIVVIDNIAGKEEAEEITFTITNVRAIDIDMNEIAIDALSTIINADIDAINEVENNRIHIYPNPVSGNAVYFDPNVLKGIEKITLFDITGKQLKEFSASEIYGGTLFLEEFANGQYELKIQTGNSILSQKLIITR